MVIQLVEDHHSARSQMTGEPADRGHPIRNVHEDEASDDGVKGSLERHLGRIAFAE